MRSRLVCAPLEYPKPRQIRRGNWGLKQIRFSIRRARLARPAVLVLSPDRAARRVRRVRRVQHCGVCTQRDAAAEAKAMERAGLEHSGSRCAPVCSALLFLDAAVAC